MCISQANLFPRLFIILPPRFYVAAMKGKGDPEKHLSVLSEHKAWLGLASVLHCREMLYVTYLHFRFPHLPGIDITSIRSLFLCKLLTTLTGSPQRKVFGLVGSSLYSIQLHYESSRSRNSGQRTPFRSTSGYWLQHRWVGGLSQEKKSKTENGKEGRSQGQGSVTRD